MPEPIWFHIFSWLILLYYFLLPSKQKKRCTHSYRHSLSSTYFIDRIGRCFWCVRNNKNQRDVSRFFHFQPKGQQFHQVWETFNRLLKCQCRKNQFWRLNGKRQNQWCENLKMRRDKCWMAVPPRLGNNGPSANSKIQFSWGRSLKITWGLKAMNDCCCTLIFFGACHWIYSGTNANKKFSFWLFKTRSPET